MHKWTRTNAVMASNGRLPGLPAPDMLPSPAAIGRPCVADRRHGACPLGVP